MGLLQEWREYAYGVELNSKEGKAIWDKYFEQEKAIYQQLLAAPEEVVSGTVQELADKYGMELNYMVGFLDGINESLKEPNPIEEMEADTVVKLPIDLESLFIVSRKSPVQLLRSARLGVMSHVHADPGRNTNIAVAVQNNSLPAMIAIRKYCKR